MKIVEMFQSIQGEGLRTGVPSFFIRTWGCNLRCTWCDTKYSYDDMQQVPAYRIYHVDEIVQEYNNKGFGDVVITGGEPFVQVKELEDLIYAISSPKRAIFIETNATVFSEVVAVEANMVLSPKISFREVSEDAEVILKYCTVAMNGHRLPPVQIKLVIDNEGTFDTARGLARLLNSRDVQHNVEWIFTPDGTISGYSAFSEALEAYSERLQWLAELVLKDCNKGIWKVDKVRVLPQLHKIVWGNRRGV